MNNILFRFIAILLLLLGATGSAHAQTPTYAPATGIRVLVYGIHHGGNLVYNYKVINNTGAQFGNFTIGSYFYTDTTDPTANGEYPQLTRLPLGWTYGREGETGTEIILAPGSTSQPQSWTSHVFGQQEASNYYLKWRASRGSSGVSSPIQPGQTLGGFSVTVPPEDSNLLLPMVTGSPAFTGPDEMYIKGGFKVGHFPAGGKEQDVWGTLEREDTTPPTLTVTLNPSTLWPANDKLVPVTATITVHDDYDPAPEIRLEAITVNETASNDDASGIQPGTDDRQFQLKAKRAGNNMAGRIYTVTYSATDGSGNKTMASATVTVPHDQGKK